MYGECECFVMQMLYLCVLCASCGSSQCCVLHDLQLVKVEDAIGDHTEGMVVCISWLHSYLCVWM